MPDQADELRLLALEKRGTTVMTEAAPNLLVVAGGKGGVGTTTVATRLARCLSSLAVNTLLIDADLCRADATATFGLQPPLTLVDLLAGRCPIEEVIVPANKGLQILPAAWTPSEIADTSRAAQRKLVESIHRLQETNECIVVDAGNNVNSISHRLVQLASHLLLVTTPDNVAVMDTYAALKLLCGDAAGTSARRNVSLLVNRVAEPHQATDVLRRVALTARRFLDINIESAGHLPDPDSLASGATAAQRPGVLSDGGQCAPAIKAFSAMLIASTKTTTLDKQFN